MSKPVVFVLVGATASGKTDVSLTLASRLPLEIVNSDSLQVFRHLDIGTSKVTAKEREQAPHHLIDVLNPDETFTAKDFQRVATETIEGILRREKYPLLVGGAGFYLKALLYPSEDLPSGTVSLSDPQAAYQKIIESDPDLQGKIHPNDHYRISRALFLLENGKKPSQAFGSVVPLPWNIHWIGIQTERPQLRQQIEQRVHRMFEAGLVAETESVLQNFPASESRLEKAIGYHQSLEILRGNMRTEEAITDTVIKTQQYAKRQDTWFRKNTEIQWADRTQAVETFTISMRKTIQV